MAKEWPGYRVKSPEQLFTQIDQVSERLGKIIVPHTLGQEVVDLSLQELKSQLPLRYAVYLNLLRSLYQPEKEAKVSRLEKIGIAAANRMDEYIQMHYASEDGRILREKQIGVFEEMKEFLEEGGAEGYLKLPTGSGKTVLFVQFIEATGLRSLVVAPTTIIVDQTVESFRRFAPNVDVGIVHKDHKEYERNITVTTYDSLVIGVKEGKIIPTDYDLLVLDETHHALTPRRLPTVRKFENSLKLGFTATAEYSEEKK